MDLAHAGPSALAAFLASLVEFVEALTIVLAVGSVRGWRSALAGAGVALAALLLLVALLGPALARVPLDAVRIGVGALLLLFGMRWLRTAMLRAAGALPLHDEDAAFARQAAALGPWRGQGWDRQALATTFKITMIEGVEVVFIVVAIGAGGQGLLLPASLGALAALALVAALGLALHRPVSRIPENTLKLGVGVLLCAFGTFWLGEGFGYRWPGADWSLLALALGFLATALAGARWRRASRRGPA